MKFHEWKDTGIRATDLRSFGRSKKKMSRYECTKCGLVMNISDVDIQIEKKNPGHIHTVAKETVQSDFQDCDLTIVAMVMKT